jgi:hypothetical protein
MSPLASLWPSGDEIFSNKGIAGRIDIDDEGAHRTRVLDRREGLAFGRLARVG